MPDPFFMAVEGTDKSGKSTAALKLMQRLLALDVPIALVQDPGSTKTGNHVKQAFTEENRMQPLTEALLFEAARHEMVETRIKPALAKSTNVISIRYTTSTTAYQGYAGGVPLEIIANLNQLATGGLEPDLTLIIDVPIRIARDRGTSKDAFETRSNTFYEKVRAGYLDQAAAHKDKIKVIDGTQPPEAVVTEMLELALALLKK